MVSVSAVVMESTTGVMVNILVQVMGSGDREQYLCSRLGLYILKFDRFHGDQWFLTEVYPGH